MNCTDLGCPGLSPNTKIAHCSTCHETFNSDAGFDKHRVGGYENRDTGKYNTRRCLTVEEMLELGLSRNTRGRWVTQEFPRDKAGFKGLKTPGQVLTPGGQETQRETATSLPQGVSEESGSPR